MKPRWAIVTLLFLISAARGGDNPFDVLQRAYTPYMASDDPLAFPMKVRSLSADPYKFWRGSKDLFFIWYKTGAADWLSDTKAFLPNHGDLHLGNIGTYASETGWGKLAFGMVDFDDSSRLPFQIELLQGLITLQLTARQNAIPIDDAQLCATLMDSYRISVNSRRNATSLLIDNEDLLVSKILGRGSIAYDEQLAEYTIDGKFRPLTRSAKGKLKDILRPAMNRADEMAAGIAQAMANEPDMKRLFKFSSQKEIRTAVKDVVQRTRLDSSGSQGLKKYLVLLSKPLRGIDSDFIVYLKQEIPSAAERSGVVPHASGTPGQRVKLDMDHLTEPRPFINSWCDIGNESYWVHFKEPWSDELSPDDVKTTEELLHMTKIWGTVAGATHREEGRFEIILPRLTPALAALIHERSKMFIKILDEDFSLVKSDPRVQELVKRADSALKESASN